MRSSLASVETAPCARCLKKTPGIRWGDLCADCTGELRRRARPAARGISLIAALLVIAYAYFQIRLGLASRVWVAAIALGTYFLVRRIVTQVAIEVLRNR